MRHFDHGHPPRIIRENRDTHISAHHGPMRKNLTGIPTSQQGDPHVSDGSYHVEDLPS